MASWCIQPFGHNRNGPKIGRGCAPFWGRAASPSNTKSPGPRPTSIPNGILIHAAIWPQQIWAENWGLCLFGGGGAGSPSKTYLPAHQVSSWSIQPFGHNTLTLQTDRTDRQWSDSIGQTILQNGCPKTNRSDFQKAYLVCINKIYAFQFQTSVKNRIKNKGTVNSIFHCISSCEVFDYQGWLIMAALRSRCGHYIFVLWFLLLFLAYFQPSHIGWLPYFHTWCGFSANLGCRSETCCMRLAENTGTKNCQKFAIRHHSTTLSGYIFATKAHIDNRKKTC